MKFRIDLKFFATTAITFVLFLAIVALIEHFLGGVVATAGGVLLGALIVKAFDKLDYTAASDVESGAPAILGSWAYAALAAILIVYGCILGADLWGSAWRRVDPESFPCAVAPLLLLVLLDWGGFVLAGWTIGRLFPDRALALSSLAAFVCVFAYVLKPGSPEAAVDLVSCFIELYPENVDAARTGFAIGDVVGVVSRGYVSIVFARMASRKSHTGG